MSSPGFPFWSVYEVSLFVKLHKADFITWEISEDDNINVNSLLLFNISLKIIFYTSDS